MFKFYINNVQVNDPSNWKDFSELLEYDIENNTFLYSYPNEMEWNGGAAYSDLINKFDNDNSGYSELRVEQDICGTYKNIFIGNIFHADLKVNRMKCNISAKITDNNFKAFLNNNKNIEIYLGESGISYTKNGTLIPVSLNAFGQSLGTSLFNPATGVYYAGVGGLYGHLVYDAFKLLIAYLSDLNVEFRSNYLDYSQPIVTSKDRVKGLLLVSGDALYHSGQSGVGGTGNPCKISLYSLLKNINRWFPIGYYVDYDFNGTPTFVVEDLDYFLNNTTVLSYTKVDDIEEEMSLEAYYSQIKIGGQYVDYNSNTTILKFENAAQYGFQDEPYFFDKQENIDKELDLSNGDVIVDTNIIQLLTFNTVGGLEEAYGQYKENNFFLEMDDATSYTTALKTANNTINNSSYYHYNENLLNVNTIQRINNLGDIYFIDNTTVNNLVNTSPKKYLKKYKFNKFVSDNDYQILKSNLVGKIEVNIDRDGNTNTGWIKRFERKFYNGESNIELRAE